MSFLCNNNDKILTFYNVYCKEIIIISNLSRNDMGLITILIGRLTVT